MAWHAAAWQDAAARAPDSPLPMHAHSQEDPLPLGSNWATLYSELVAEAAEAFHAAAAWYQTPESAAHAADLGSFMDLERMLTVVIADECAIPGPPLTGTAG